MSYRMGSSDRRHTSSRDSRRDSSPSRHRSSRRSPPGSSRRSESPKPPRDPRNLPESFGRAQESRTDDDLSVLQRMKSSYENSPLQCLYHHLEKHHKVKIWTRNYKEVRGVMTGYIVAFDKHWNIILSDVDEVFLKPKKNKAPFLRVLKPNEMLPDIPVKVPKKKSSEKVPTPPPPPPKKDDSKKRKRGKKAKAVSEKRQMKMLFIRGDNIVIVCPAEDDSEDEEDEEEEETAAEETVEVKTEPDD